MATIPGEQTETQRAATLSAAGMDPANPGGVISPAQTQLQQDSAKAANQGKPGYDAIGNPVPNSPASPVPGAVPSPSDYYSRVGPEPTPVVAQTAEEIQAKKETDAKSLIDAINAEYDSQLKEQTTLNDSRTSATNAVSLLTGLGGSSEANVAANKTATLNKSENDKINNQRAVAIQGILSKISDAAVQEAKQSRDEARQSAEDISTYRAKAATDAVQHLTELSKVGSGATLEGLKATLPPDEYAYLVKNAGGEDAVRAVLFANRPKSTLTGTPTIVGNYVVQHYTQPDGSDKTEYTALPKEVIDSIANDPKNISVEKTDTGLYFLNKATKTFTQVPNSGKLFSPKSTDPKNVITISAPQKTKIISLGYTAKDITAMQADLQKYSLSDVLAGEPDASKRAELNNILTGQKVTSSPFGK